MNSVCLSIPREGQFLSNGEDERRGEARVCMLTDSDDHLVHHWASFHLLKLERRKK